ncbi:MAG: o-succinylbenzoate synthase [Gemmatimonadota bacterium]|nr:o-succinylbenzoate synthase [Gemmatimonadota bacterium]
MKISKLEVYHIRLPLTHHFEISSGRLTHIDSILVRIRSRGEQGWGEAPPWNTPIYGHETAETAYHIIKDIFAPCVLNKNFDTPESLNTVLGKFRGNGFAKAALETAWWVLNARLDKKPLHKLIGGQSDKPINCGNSLGIEKTPDLLLEAIQKSLDVGYQRIKIKVKPGWDIDILDKVRTRFPKAPLQVDANSAYTLSDIQILKRFDDYSLIQIEQPLACDDILDHAALQAEIRTPVCLDESIKSSEDIRKAAQIKACKIVNIKLSRVGGIYEAKKIYDICAENEIQCWVGGMLESAIGESICIEFASLPNIEMPSDIFPSNRFYKVDTTEPYTEMSGDGTFYPSKKPGIGHDPDLDKIRSLTVKKWVCE